MKRRNKLALWLLGTIVLSVLALQTPLLRAARRQVWDGWVSTIARVAEVGQLRVDNDVMEQVAQLRADNIRLQAEQEDYRRLRRDLGSTSFTQLRTIPALAAVRPLDTFRTEFMINRGWAEGAVINAPVVVQGSVLIGLVTDVSEHAATVRLLLHPEQSLPAEVVGKDNSRGLLRGRAYTSLVLSTVPRDAELALGEAVVTVAQEGIPQGLLVGTVEAVQNEKNEAYQEAVVKLPYNPDELMAVTVLVQP
ncbi:MAG: rod shape-determining protein MreC [Candidatus Andersenbacteria bacterium]|nr:rod shape-determining protein MreC [bacterium]MDZ4225777.1 rod shape-determining protein MreC [Candidatus Andersenbacteria bacterium]